MNSSANPDRRATVDANRFRPEDLPGLSDEDFRAVVDADLRRKAPKSGVTLKPDLIEALRSPAVAPRWFAMLLRMQKSVDGQLGARENDYQGERARIDMDIQRLVTKMEKGGDVRDPDSSRTMSRDEAEEKLSSLKLRRHGLRAGHMRTKAATVRFKTGLDEATLEAKFLRDSAVSNTFETVVALERDYYADRARTLERAIEAHRKGIMSELDTDDEDPDDIDTDLWAAITPAKTPALQ